MTAAHVLVVIRHAKAEPHGRTDFERALAERGHRDARAAGTWLAGAGVVPDAALVSSARRTRETWQEVSDAAGWRIEPDLSRAVYGADEYEVLDQIRLVDEQAGCLVVIGHNPTMHGLVHVVGEDSGDPDALARLATGFPTSAVAVLDVPVPWAGLVPGAGTLRSLHVARG